MGIKDKVIDIIGFDKYRVLLSTVMRCMKQEFKKMRLHDDYELEKYWVEGKNTYFGYYDIQSISDDNSKLLSLVIDEQNNIAEVGYFGISNHKFNKVADSKAWNWQMGCRLRWWSNQDSVLFNDYDGNKYISRVVGLDGNELCCYDFPLFDITHDFKYGFYTDFNILNSLRPGYGYKCQLIDFEKYYKECKNGIYLANLENNFSEMILSLDQIKNYNPTEDMIDKYHYINHISVSPNDEYIMFFHIWTDKIKWKTRMFIIDRTGKVINVIDDFERSSHYTWKDDEHLLTTVQCGKKQEYRLYNVITGDYVLDELLNRDGHPTYINKAQYITDTYPDRCAMQHIYLCEEHISKMELLSVYHVPNKVGEYRCDLHPRIKNDLINIDCVMYRERCQFILKPKDSTKTHKKAKSISKEVYSTLTGKIGCNYLSLLYNKCFNTTFKAHYLVLKMLRTKSKLCKNMIFNKLQSKYSMWVSPDCSLGKNVRFMHIQGIVIGSGVTVGDNCILYQQVTLGKEKGAFPVIGNNVKIYAGAKVIGNVKVGDNAVIGANAVVTHDVPPNAVVGGVPARILKQNEGK